MSDASPVEPSESTTALDPRLPGDSLAHLRDLWQRHGDYVRLQLLGSEQPAYLLNEPTLIEQLLAQHHDNISRGFAGDRLSLMLGNGLLVSDGDRWRTQRQLMHPLFHRRALSWLGATAEQCNGDLIDRFDSFADTGRPLDLNRAMLEFSLQFNLRILFGEDAERIQSAVGDDFFEKLTEEPAGTTKENLTFLRDTQRLKDLLQELMKERQNLPPAGQPNLLDQLTVARDRRSGTTMTAAQAVDEVLSLLTAGHVTVASGLSSIWRILMRHPEAIARLRAEARRVCAGQPASTDTYTHLSFTRRCVQEALRLAPPIWIMTRKAIRPIRLGAATVPADSQLVVSPYLVHRHTAHWPDPLTFEPDRFLPAAVRARNRYAYLPFSAGPRSCLGDQLSLLEKTLHVASIVQKFDLTIVDDRFVSEPGFVYRSKAPFTIRLARHGPL